MKNTQKRKERKKLSEEEIERRQDQNSKKSYFIRQLHE